MIKSPPISYYLKSLVLRPATFLITLATLIGARIFSGGVISLPGGVISLPWIFWPLSWVILAAGGIGLISFWAKDLMSQEFREKVQKDWTVKSLTELQKTLREASKKYERQRARPNYQRNRYDRIRKMEKDMFVDLARIEDLDDPLTQEVLEQSVRGFLRYYELLNRDQRLASLLENSNIMGIKEEADGLLRRAEHAGTYEAKLQYQRAAEFKLHELRTLERVRQSNILLQAHLDTLESALSSLRARLINTTIWGQEGLRFELSQLTQELLALEKSMEEFEELETESIIQINQRENI